MLFWMMLRAVRLDFPDCQVERFLWLIVSTLLEYDAVVSRENSHYERYGLSACIGTVEGKTARCFAARRGRRIVGDEDHRFTRIVVLYDNRAVVSSLHVAVDVDYVHGAITFDL